MRNTLFAAALLAAMATAALAGPLSKFDSKAPDFEQNLAVQEEDVERCLIDADTAPFVYRQPDKPDDVTLLWTASPGIAVFRVDLHRLKMGTHIKGWIKQKLVGKCLK